MRQKVIRFSPESRYVVDSISHASFVFEMNNDSGSNWKRNVAGVVKVVVVAVFFISVIMISIHVYRTNNRTMIGCLIVLLTGIGTLFLFSMERSFVLDHMRKMARQNAFCERVRKKVLDGWLRARNAATKEINDEYKKSK
jgi:uncharacterized membrane protein